MDLAPTPEQQAVQGEARRFLAAELTRERLAAFDREPAGHDAAFWRDVAALGWFGYGLPEDAGGQGASILEVGLLLEECGRAAAPHGVFAAIGAALGVDKLASSAQKRVWLPALAAGARHATIAIAERDAVNDPRAFATVVSRRGRGLVLRGTKCCVPQAVTADVFLVIARSGRQGCAVLVPADAPGVSVRPLGTLGKDRQSVVAFDGVTLPAGALCGRPASMWPRWLRLRRRLAMLLCAEMVGGAEAVLEMTVRHVCEREQFGARLGTFQAVQQMTAVMAMDLEGARHVTRQALWRLAAGLPADREVAIAKAWSGRAYRNVTVLAHQLHGGAGYVIEHPLHRHSLRAQEAELLLGSGEEWLSELADGLRLDGGRS
jgi:alkylation response protein AidB-like acyl-CoA dehydrogenase